MHLAHSFVGRDVHQVTAGQVIYLSPDKAQDKAEQWERRYVQWVFEKTWRLYLDGIDEKIIGTERADCLQSAEIYTPLLTLSAETSSEVAKDQERPQRERLRSAVEMLNAERRLVLLGDPGSGKSMFINMLALCMAGQRLEESCANLEHLRQPLPDDNGEPGETPQAWEHGCLLPVIFTLRDVAAKTLTTPSNAPGSVAQLLEYLRDSVLTDDAKLPQYAPYLETHLEKKGGLILFDGLDEVPDAEQFRKPILQMVENFAIRFKKCRILVTCRTYAYHKQNWQLKGGFPTVMLSPFTDGQIHYFVARWYRHVADIRGTNREDWEGRAAALKQAIFQKEQLLSFARSPLLLTLMASLHAWRQGSLPDERAKLYDDATNMLLDTWVKQKRVRRADGSYAIMQSREEIGNIPAKAIKDALSRLAFEVHRKQPAEQAGTADIAQADLEQALSDACRVQHLHPGDLTEHLSTRVGLLASHGNGVYRFPHRTFQEYLAAWHLATAQDQDYPTNIVTLIAGDITRWREVLVLSAAVASGKVWDLVEELCGRDLSETRAATQEEAYAAIFAAQSLKEVGIDFTKRLSPAKEAKIERMRRWLKAILTEGTAEPCQGGIRLPAQERARAGDLLAAFGDDRKGVGIDVKTGLPDIDFVEIQPGEFYMGSDESEREKPRHRVTFREPFWMSRYPVTNAQYQAFVKAGGYENETYWKAGGGWEYRIEYNWNGPRQFSDARFGLPNHPVVGVSWYEAMAFCAWLTEKTHLTPCPLSEGEGECSPPCWGGDGGGVIRLPTEAEWEYAARGQGETYHRYPWGDEITPEFANYDDTNIGATSAVGCFPRGKSRFSGCEEMSGNVYEWCLDVWQENYKNAPDDGSAILHGNDDDYRVMRGGYYGASSDWMRCAFRNGVLRPHDWDCFNGFRVVRSGVGLPAVSPF